MKDNHCKKCESPLSLNELYDILMDKLEPHLHSIDVFKCSFCEHENHVPVQHKPTYFR